MTSNSPSASASDNAGSDRQMRLLKRYLAPRIPRVFLLAACLLVGTALSLVGPLMIRDFIDTAMGDATASMADHLTFLTIAFIVAALAAQAVEITMNHLSEQIGWWATNDLRADLTAHTLNLDLSFHHDHSPGELLERVDGDVSALAASCQTPSYRWPVGSPSFAPS